MSLLRLCEVAKIDLVRNLRRPLFWFQLLLVGLIAWGMSTGDMQIASGDANVGGTKAWITSEFAQAQIFALTTLLVYAFFVAIDAGMAIMRDDECKIGELLHSTSLRPSEYIWGKYLASFLSFCFVLALQIGLQAFFNHNFVSAEGAEIVGRFQLLAYLRPALAFSLPFLLFISGVCFCVGERTRKPILVFVLPVAWLLLCAFFLWDTSDTTQDPRVDRALQWVDPSGFRWLNQTWLKVDRGVEFYNHAPVEFDRGFLLSRLALCGIGLVAVAWSSLRFAATVRGSRVMRGKSAAAPIAGPSASSAPAAPIAELGMTQRVPSFVAGLLEVARVELRELRSQPGLYLFVPLIVLETWGRASFDRGTLGTELLATPGMMAARSVGLLTTLLCFLLLFYTIESLRREERAHLDQIQRATPVRSTSVLFGKALANAVVGIVVLFAAFLTCVVVLLLQGSVPVEIGPFVLTWSLIVPTILLWCAFVAATYSIVRNAYAVYGIALGVLALTGYGLLLKGGTWVWNWPLWGAISWSDMGAFELDRRALWLNRGVALSLALFLLVVAVRAFPRRSSDPTRLLVRLRPKPLFIGALKLLPLALPPIALGLILDRAVDAGFGGDAADKAQKDYWRKNVATWKDALVPDIARADVELALEPERRFLAVKGSFALVNPHEVELRAIPLTGGLHWRSPTDATKKADWTLDGAPFLPEDRANLFVFALPTPLGPGETTTIGFAFEGELPGGISKNGGGAGEFVLPGGVVLTSFTPSFVPVVGYVEEIGVDEENRTDAKEYADDFHVGRTLSLFGQQKPYPVRVEVSAPQAYTVNSIGTLVSDEVVEGRRRVVWETDHPVHFFNVVAGRWEVQRGDGTALFYHPEHVYNVEEMSSALDAARRHFSDWFGEFPWRELKISEFPAHANYAQGFATNITFSEGIGFLTKSDAKSNLAFMVTAHEIAHNWWGNRLVPGRGPGGNVLSEGMSHFSTLLLFDEVKGLAARIEFAKRLEENYGEERVADSERPLARMDGTRPGDTTVTYDKGGWVFWMLLQEIGRAPMLSALRDFLAFYEWNPDHPVLQDFVDFARAYASDAAAYDAFVEQWFFGVVVPEYTLAEVESRLISAEGEAPRHEVSFRVKNKGSGRMRVEIAASRGERFPEADPGADSAAEPYLEARASVVLGAGEEAVLSIPCEFQPERVTVDPDAFVLQLRRKHAEQRL